MHAGKKKEARVIALGLVTYGHEGYTVGFSFRQQAKPSLSKMPSDVK